MRILKDRFCSLSRSKDFQVFLKNLDSELYQSLINHLQLNEGCDSNKIKMSKIYRQIKKNGKELELLNFMKEKYPHMVVKTKEDSIKKPDKPNIKTKKMTAATPSELYDKMNHHKVFDVYRPKLFFIPQRRIFVGPSRKDVLNSINRFVQFKLEVDYIILEGPELWHGYVEYFDVRFKDHIKKFDHSQKSITKYRKLHGIR